MTSESSTSAPSSAETQSKPSIKKRQGMSQERMMVMFTLFFALGVLLLVFIPEDHWARGISMGIYSIVVFWAMFRFGK